MPSAPSPSHNDLDISCLRHLISRHHSLSQLVLPSAAALPKYQRALSRLHGPADHTRLIATQALHTAMCNIFSSLFPHGPAEGDDLLTVIRIVHYVIGLDLDHSLFTPAVQTSMFIAYVHAVIRWFPSVPREQWGERYRAILDLLRSPTWTLHLGDVKGFGITEFKSAVSSVHKLPKEQVRSRSSSKIFAANFEMHYPLRKLRISFQRHINSIANRLPALRFNVGRREQMQRNGGVIDVDGVPEFFSDAEYAGTKGGVKEGRFSPMQSDEDVSTDEENEDRPACNTSGSAPTRVKVRERQGRPSRLSKGGAAYSPKQKVTRKSLINRSSRNSRKRSDVQDGDNVAEDEAMANKEEEGDESVRHGEDSKGTDKHEDDPSDIEKPGKGNKCNGVGNRETTQHVSPADLRELDQLASDAFYGSDDPSHVTHLARRKRSRRASERRRHSSGKKVNPVNKDVSERRMGVHDGDRSSVAGELEENDSEVDPEHVRGREGEVVRQLRDATSRLSRRTRLDDPLSKSLQEARGARKKSRKSYTGMYSPAPDARSASPIPDSDTPVSRKRGKRFQLSSDSDDFTRNGRRVRQRRSPAKLYGRFLRSGRFEPFEDEDLEAGLTKYGWGAWTEIAKNFGAEGYTRTPMSLKDRARTLLLDPSRFPEPTHKRGRPRLHNERRQEGISKDNTEEDIDEDSDANLQPQN